MILVSILQYIDGAWVHLGDIRGRSYNRECQKFDELQKQLNSNTITKIIPIRQDIGSILLINLDHGPVRLTIRD